jgi:hypothetical protein
MSTFITTVSGRHVDLSAPDWREIDIEDVARGLSQVARFAGQARRGFGVGQHSLVVADLAPPALKLAALLHDAHEAFLGEWTGPGQEAVCLLDPHARAAIRRVQRGLDRAIARRVLEDVEASPIHGVAMEAALIADEMLHPKVVAADRQALALEMSIKGQDALQSGGAEVARACALYGAFAPNAGVIALEWLAAVRAAAFERYGDEP